MSKKTAPGGINDLMRVAAQLKVWARERAEDKTLSLTDRAKPFTHNFPHGARVSIRLALANNVEVWRLRIARPGKYTTGTEIDTFVRDFGGNNINDRDKGTYIGELKGVLTTFYADMIQWNVADDLLEKKMIELSAQVELPGKDADNVDDADRDADATDLSADLFATEQPVPA